MKLLKFLLILIIFGLSGYNGEKFSIPSSLRKAQTTTRRPLACGETRVIVINGRRRTLVGAC